MTGTLVTSSESKSKSFLKRKIHRGAVLLTHGTAMFSLHALFVSHNCAFLKSKATEKCAVTGAILYYSLARKEPSKA